MPCFYPLSGYYSRFKNPKTGKRPIVFNLQDAFSPKPVQFACGQCIWCRLERSKAWALRCVHEASQFEDNCFLTLTYSDENLPQDHSLNVQDFQKFMKRFRKRFKGSKAVLDDQGRETFPIRFFHCGEYGDRFGRPHYHAVIFNFDFPDRKFYKESRGVKLYTSAILSELWPFGWATVGNVTWESAAYVARYVTKKVTGKAAEDHYQVMDDTGRFFKVKPEYTTMSRRPGIGYGWFSKFKDDIFPDDFAVHRGKKLKVPKFYDRIFEKDFPSDFERVKKKRKSDALVRAPDNTPERLAVKETILNQRFDRLKRGFENG